MLVYVINKHGQPLMPCGPRRARLLLKQGKAAVVRREPFTIRLLYGSSGYKQPITLGVDAGSKVVGLSATTENRALFEGEVQLRGDIVELLAARRALRRGRRSRKTRYRQARFNNRKRPEGWLAPSVRNRIDAHLKAIALVHSMLPVTRVIIEVAQFDIQKIKNPDIQGKEYQQGDQLDFWNVREYVLFRDNHLCQGRQGCRNAILNVHHIESRRVGGDAPNNLVTLCERCHADYHAGKLELNLKRGASFRDAAFMGVMRWALYRELRAAYPDVRLTYGYITKHARIHAGLAKSHRADARCISGAPHATPGVWYRFKQARRQNRQLHKLNFKRGKRQANKAPRYVHGFQLFDKVEYRGQECFIYGRRSSGYFDLRRLDGTRVSASASVRNIRLLERAGALLCEKGGMGDFLPRMNSGVSVA